jgi:UDP-N-acetylmuramate-alanine ligase
MPARTRRGDVILIMGAGDIGGVARDLIRHLGGQPAGERKVVTKE